MHCEWYGKEVHQPHFIKLTKPGLEHLPRLTGKQRLVTFALNPLQTCQRKQGNQFMSICLRILTTKRQHFLDKRNQIRPTSVSTEQICLASQNENHINDVRKRNSPGGKNWLTRPGEAQRKQAEDHTPQPPQGPREANGLWFCTFLLQWKFYIVML